MLKILQEHPDSASTERCWIFPGQGSQDVGMGEQILKLSPRARKIFEMAEQLAGLPLRQLMARGPAHDLARSDVVQPALVALSCAYVDFLRDRGETPSVVAGHSLGELSALYAAEVLELNDVLRLATTRGRLMAEGPPGGMVVLQNIPQTEIEGILKELHEGIVCLANLNAPTQLVVSGDETGLNNLADILKQRQHNGTSQTQAQRLNVCGAWHSPLVAVASYEFSKHLQSTKFSNPSVAVAMSSQAALIESAADLKNIISRQMTMPVRWYETVEMLIDHGVRHFWEVGSGKVLKGLMRRILPSHCDYRVESLGNRRFLQRLVEHDSLHASEDVG